MERNFWTALYNLLVGATSEQMQQVQDLSAQNKELTNKVKALNDYVYQLQKTDDGKAQKIIDLEATIADNDKRITDLTEGIESLKVALAATGEIDAPLPNFLDENKPAYTPWFQFFKPDGTLSGVTCDDPRDVYAFFNFQKKWVYENDIKNLSKHQKLMAIWKWVTDAKNRYYEYDYNDNWQLAIQTYYRKKGDCEDSSILFVTFARVAGIRPDEIFLSVGDSQWGYHAYPIIYYSDEEAKEFGGNAGWYIFESTLSGYCPPKPSQLLGAKYWVDSIANWKFAGIVKSDQKLPFNGNYTGSTYKKIDNSEEKQKRIQEYWINMHKV